MNKKEELLHAQVKNRFVDFLKAASLPYWEPELTVCPRCGEHVGITLGCLWSCEHCNIRGDVVDYVMELEHMADKLSAIKRICRALQIKITSLDVIRADELMDTQFETGNILIDKLMGQGVYLIAGSPKIGKSWLMLWLAHRVSMGEDVWNFKTNKCDVLYISLEDPRHRVQDRLARVTRGETGNVWIATESELMGKGFEEQLIGFLCENPAVKFVIIDTLQRVRQMRADQYSYAGDYEVISQMKSIADRFGITILLVHHTRKAGANDPFAMISGTTGLSGGVDGSLVLLKPDRQDHHAILYATGRDTQDMAMDLLFDEDTTTWKFIGFAESERTQRRENLLGVIDSMLYDEEEFHGTASELLECLAKYGETKVKSANALTRLLNPNKAILWTEFGILYECERTGKERKLHLMRVRDDGNDDSDDKNPGGDDTVITVTG